ncbi:MAG: hypothetical protein EAZ95_19175 [Bacteroidetes bacterium]|nr:MAG: hypothetical protein EAZ95_19175 [Bacteroidota bacterium]
MQTRSFKIHDSWYKTEVVCRLESSTYSVGDLAAEVGIHTNTLYRWVQEYRSGKLDKTNSTSMANKRSKGSVTARKKATSTSLEKEVELLRLKVLAFETMIDIAESELGIVIRKKSFAKPSTSSVASTASTPLSPASGASVDGLATADKPTTSAKQAPKNAKKGGK